MLTWFSGRRRARRRAPAPAAEATAALAALAVLLLVLWVLSPYALVLALPAAHAALLATAARRSWQLAALAGVALLPVLALTLTMAGLLDTGAPFALWYLAETAVTGARGATGLVLGVLTVSCIWSIGALVVRRGLRTTPRERPRPRRQFTRPRLPGTVHPPD